MATTFTITSVDMLKGETIALVSRVVESRQSAFEHLRGMARSHDGITPYRVASSAGIRWTWEGRTPEGRRWSDTVRVIG